jgi:hypothetical protein
MDNNLGPNPPALVPLGEVGCFELHHSFSFEASNVIDGASEVPTCIDHKIELFIFGSTALIVNVGDNPFVVDVF